MDRIIQTVGVSILIARLNLTLTALDSHIHMEFKMEVQEGTAAAIDRLVSTLPTAKSEGIDTDFLE